MTGLSEPLARLLGRFRAGERPALARAISLVEDEREGFQPFLHEALSDGPRATRVGLTGPPGAGKSTLVAALAAAYRADGEEVGVVAVDPTSPYSGGALLGDRIRMNELAVDPGIFIRSMATRGSLGGLATTTREVVDLMDAFGFPRLLIETVGVGQTQLEISKAADTVVVVLVPESGDAIQAMKAGLMEIADIFVVNKADRPGAERLLREIQQAVGLRSGEALRGGAGHHGAAARLGQRVAPRPAATESPAAADPGWRIPVLGTVAHSGEGVPGLIEALGAHADHLRQSGELDERRRGRAERRIRDVVERDLRRLAWAHPGIESALREGLTRIAEGAETPYSVARSLLDGFLGR